MVPTRVHPLNNQASFGDDLGMAPCRTCGDTLEIIQGKAASYILPVGIRPGALHEDFYDNIVERPSILDVDDNFRYICVCGDPETHIHCLQCMTGILKKYTKLGMDIPKVAYPESLRKPLHWKTLVSRLRNSIITPDPSERPIRTEPPCLCQNIIKSTFFSKKPTETLLSFLKFVEPRPPKCSHRAASRTLKHGNPNAYPRSIADGYAHDESLGKQMGLMYEQLTGGTVLGRFHETPILIKDQTNHSHYWIMKNNDPSHAKGYGDSIPQETFSITTPLTVFHDRFGEDNCCHAICDGDIDPHQYAMCRLVECGYIIWLIDLGVLDLPCCGECDFDVIAVTLASSIDIADRIRDTLTGEMFNINHYPSRQSSLALEMWKCFVVHGVDRETICCRRAEWSYRLVRNMCIWMFCNPVYYTHKAAQAEGIMKFAEAMNGYLMKTVRRSQDGCKDIGKEGPLLVDDIVTRFIAARLVDFLVYFCA
ncbi:hypothetical protein TWF481_006065 [Arthrobotrys musiformis]|uniref:Uncharacterized protein n=1 Tax=Arthrobotrys musiformis TaxID=47236 RepID=A0AAV9WHM0_9PEZI